MKYSVILGNLGNTRDRFLSSGYKSQVDKETMIQQASEIEGVTGVELVGSWDITDSNTSEVCDLLEKYNLKCASIIPDLFAQKRWGRGTYSSKDNQIRQQAVEETQKMAEIARKLQCTLINIWPGQDGYDYPLQADFRQERQWLKESLKEICENNSDIKFSLEYKLKEPRTHSYISSCANTLLLTREIDLENLGVTIDTGHSLAAQENVAEAVVMLTDFGDKLFHMHFNDNYRTWDDDMIVGSVHLAEYVELLFWLKEIGYDGWYSMDQYPYREDAQGALRESIEFLKAIDKILDETSMREIRELLKASDAVQSTAWLRKRIFK